MGKVTRTLLFAWLSLSMGPRDAGDRVQSAGHRTTSNPRLLASYAKLPLSFEANRGQSDHRVKFLSRGKGYTVLLTNDEAVLALQRPSQDAALVRMKLVGARTATVVSGLEELPGKSNYFIGRDPAKWQTQVPTYAKIRYEQPYPGIDLIYYGHQAQLEYDFVVAPGADPRAIRMRVEGARKMHIDEGGDLVVRAGSEEVRFHKPVVYQQSAADSRQVVEGRYAVKGADEVGFDIGAYDSAKALTIDPILTYSTYLGGRADDLGFGIAVDSAGNAYVTGWTASTDFPTANALQPTYHGDTDAFVAKLDATGSTLLYSTYLGGTSSDVGYGVGVDSAGNAYVTGSTYSINFPTTRPIQPANQGSGDAFVAKLNPTGSALLYSTYLGGRDFDIGYGVAADGAGNALLIGYTSSTDFPTSHPLQAVRKGPDDAFVAKLDPTGTTLLYSTYLGGSSSDGGRAIVVDGGGNAYVTGYTLSTDFPIVNPVQPTYHGNYDAFVAKLNPTGSMLLYSTYLGGTGFDDGYGIAVDRAGNAYLTGYTASTNFPTYNAFQSALRGPDAAFVSSLDPTGSRFLYSTYLGGSGGGSFGDWGSGIAVDGAGNAYVTGWSSSPDFPLFNPLQYFNPSTVPFVTALSHTGLTLLYSTYLGGTDLGFGEGIAVDGSGRAVVVGWTRATDFPTANPLQPTLKGGRDAFVARIALKPRLMAPATWTTGQDIRIHGMDFTPNGPYSVYCDPPNPDPELSAYASATGTFDQLFHTADAPPGTTFRFWADDFMSGTTAEYVFVIGR